MNEPKVLVLGGTAEARDLASSLTEAGVGVLSSLAGRVSRPRLPVGPVRIGGFGGADGLAAYLHDGGFTHLVVATHPFATRMAENAREAAASVAVPVVRLARPGWEGHPDAGTWTWADGYDAARTAAEGLGERPFLTTGRQTLTHFAPWADRDVLVRVVEPLAVPPPRWTVVLDRGPYDVEGERVLLREHGIDVLLTKDSGGRYTEAKLTAARELGVRVVVVRRPSSPAGMRELDDAAAVVRWVNDQG